MLLTKDKLALCYGLQINWHCDINSDLCCLLQSSHRFDDQSEKEYEREIRRSLEIKILSLEIYCLEILRCCKSYNLLK